MPHDALPIGTPFFWRNKLWHVESKKTQHKKIHAVAVDNDDAVLGIEEFRLLVATDQIAFARMSEDKGNLEPAPADWKPRETPKARAERKKRESILLVLERQRELRAPLIHTRREIEVLCEKNNWDVPCERTLRNWRTAAKFHESMLTPRWARCGNRRQGPDELLLAAMREVTEATIAGDDRFTMAAVWPLVTALYQKKCADKAVKPKQHGIKKLKTFLRHFNWKQLTQAQLDGRTAAAITRKAVGSITAAAYWERVELDTCTLRILIRDEDGIVIGRPVMYAAVDVCTGYPVALIITTANPSVAPFVECLRFMYLPKDKDFDARYQIKHRIEIFGKPYLLIMDNGSELVGVDATKVVEAFHGDSARCRPYAPWEKPHIERFNGIIQAFVATLPGSLESAVDDEPRDPVARGDKLMDLEELRGHIYRFVYDRYALECSESRSLRAGKALAPADLWRLMQDSHIGPRPISAREFEMTMYFKQESRALRYDGISFDGWTYHSGALARMHDELGDRDVKFLWSEQSAKVIHVQHPATGEPVRAEAKDLPVDVDRKTAEQLRKDIKAAGKTLNQRSVQARLREIEEHKAHARTTRSRGKAARVTAMMDAAEEISRRTMPHMQSDQRTASPKKGGWNFQTATGHKRGEN